MGRIGELLSFVRRTLANGANITEVKFNPGAGDNLTGTHTSDPGDDSHPLISDFVAAVSTLGTGRKDIVGYADTVNAPKTNPGEKRIYAREDANGTSICEVWLKNDGTILISNAESTVEIKPVGDISIVNSTKVTIDSPLVETTGDLTVQGNISSGGNIQADGDIAAQGDVSDATGSMQDIRDTYNGHTHIGNLGSPTGIPQQQM